MKLRLALSHLALPLVLLAPTSAKAEETRHEVLWFSETPPFVKKEKIAETAPTAIPAELNKEKPAGQHNHASGVENAVADTGERTMNHVGAKNLWLRLGNDPAKSPSAGADYILSSVRLVGIDGKVWSEVPELDNGRYRVQVPLEEMGFYNAYLTECAVKNGVLSANVVKAELLKGTCCKKGVDPAQEKAISDDTQPIELVRDHMPDEKLFTRLVSGDKLNFTVKSFGQPVEGAQVTMKTQQGWQKSLTSGKDGRVEFTMIRDYFPDWEKFYRLNKQTFLIVAEAEIDKPGVWQGQSYNSARFRTTLAGKYSPSPYDYRSYAYGLGISLGFAFFLGTAIYLYRRRRIKPFKEIRFNETA
jgi:hypothetical protein